MCFAPQRRALFQHLNCQKWSGPGVFCTFWLQNVLRATTACTFSTSQLPKVVRPWCVLYILTSKCASRHNGVQIFISHLASWLRTRRFSEPTFRPSGATDHWKNTVFRDFPTFSRICVFCPLTLSLLIFSLLIFLFSLPLPCSAFHLSILSEVWLLNFLRWPFDSYDHHFGLKLTSGADMKKRATNSSFPAFLAAKWLRTFGRTLALGIAWNKCKALCQWSAFSHALIAVLKVTTFGVIATWAAEQSRTVRAYGRTRRQFKNNVVRTSLERISAQCQSAFDWALSLPFRSSSFLSFWTPNLKQRILLVVHNHPRKIHLSHWPGCWRHLTK